MPCAAQASREALAQLLFEQFNVAGFYVSEAPILSLYAAGKLTGTAVDIGAEKIGAETRRAAFWVSVAWRLTRAAQTSARCMRACWSAPARAALSSAAPTSTCTRSSCSKPGALLSVRLWLTCKG